MMIRMGTMTIKNFEIDLDAYSNNLIFNLQSKISKPDCKLAIALKLYTGRNLRTFQAKVLSEIIETITQKLPLYSAWLLVSHGQFILDNRIIRHHKLWRTFEKNGNSLPEGERTPEFIHEITGKIKFSGAIHLKNLNADFLANFLFQKESCKITLIENNDLTSIFDLLKNGWSYNGNIFPDEFIEKSCSSNIFFINLLGRFDDDEAGALVLAKPSLIEKCFS